MRLLGLVGLEQWAVAGVSGRLRRLLEERRLSESSHWPARRISRLDDIQMSVSQYDVSDLIGEWEFLPLLPEHR